VSLRRVRREALAAQIRYLFTKHKRRYGSPRITADLQTLGWRVSKNTVAVLMRELGLVARAKRRRGTTKADRSARKAPTWSAGISPCGISRTRSGLVT
jgi:putative transposase